MFEQTPKRLYCIETWWNLRFFIRVKNIYILINIFWMNTCLISRDKPPLSCFLMLPLPTLATGCFERRSWLRYVCVVKCSRSWMLWKNPSSPSLPRNRWMLQDRLGRWRAGNRENQRPGTRSFGPTPGSAWRTPCLCTGQGNLCYQTNGCRQWKGRDVELNCFFRLSI